jgi:hypothetical protein
VVAVRAADVGAVVAAVAVAGVVLGKVDVVAGQRRSSLPPQRTIHHHLVLH